MPGKEGSGTWFNISRMMEGIEQATENPAERWGMFKGIVYQKMHDPNLEYMRRYKSKKEGKRANQD
jgi:hypothetical protein